MESVDLLLEYRNKSKLQTSSLIPLLQVDVFKGHESLLFKQYDINTISRILLISPCWQVPPSDFETITLFALFIAGVPQGGVLTLLVFVSAFLSQLQRQSHNIVVFTHVCTATDCCVIHPYLTVQKSTSISSIVQKYVICRSKWIFKK